MSRLTASQDIRTWSRAVAYVKFDALEQALIGDRAKRWLSHVASVTKRRLRPASDEV